MSPPEQALDLPQKPGTIMLFGEWHGTQEVPAYFGRTIIKVAETSNRKIVAAIEWPESEQNRLDKFLHESDDARAKSELLGPGSFVRQMFDGRTSEAMLTLLQTLREGRKRGLNLEIYAFDETNVQQLTDDQRDKAMAQNLLKRFQAEDRPTLMVLTGDIHARTKPGVPWNKTFRSMGTWLKDELNERVISIYMRLPPGTAWYCTTLKDCGVKPNGMSEIKKGLPEQEILPEPTNEGYDGVVRLRSSTASKPAHHP